MSNPFSFCEHFMEPIQMAIDDLKDQKEKTRIKISDCFLEEDEQKQILAVFDDAIKKREARMMRAKAEFKRRFF